jgi:hypothetical protein
METTDMKDIKDAGPYTLTIGLSHGKEYVYVTHRESGRQWMSKSPTAHNKDLDPIAGNIILGITKFDPRAVIGSCDSRFWMPVKRSKNTDPDAVREFGDLVGI